MNLLWAHKKDQLMFSERESYLSRMAWSCLAHENFPFTTLTAYSDERESMSQLNRVVAHLTDSRDFTMTRHERRSSRVWLFQHDGFLKSSAPLPEALFLLSTLSGSSSSWLRKSWMRFRDTLAWRAITHRNNQNCLFCRSTRHDEADLTPGILRNYLKHRLTL